MLCPTMLRYVVLAMYDVAIVWPGLKRCPSEAESISSYLSALLTIQVHPELDGRTLNIVHCLYNIAEHFSR